MTEFVPLSRFGRPALALALSLCLTSGLGCGGTKRGAPAKPGHDTMTPKATVTGTPTRPKATPPRKVAKRRAPPTRPRRPAFKPCGTAPKGMVCIPGGPFVRGSDKHRPNERPRSKVVVSTFYMDTYEVTNPIFTKCVRKGLCSRAKNFLRYRGFHEDKQPAVPVNWYNALKVCLWQGKRLPTEAEWEKAARFTDGRTYPWGNEKADCKRAQWNACKPAFTKPVGSFPANPYGLFDMAGNGYEWVMDWASKCYAGCKKACGADCAGKDPRGPCQGMLKCKGHRLRILRGGSWYWPATQMRTSWRRPEIPNSGNHRLSFRCATRDPNPKPRTIREVLDLMKALQTKPLPL